jgi:hypothetical protein
MSLYGDYPISRLDRTKEASVTILLDGMMLRGR